MIKCLHCQEPVDGVIGMMSHKCSKEPKHKYNPSMGENDEFCGTCGREERDEIHFDHIHEPTKLSDGSYRCVECNKEIPSIDGTYFDTLPEGTQIQLVDSIANVIENDVDFRMTVAKMFARQMTELEIRDHLNY